MSLRPIPNKGPLMKELASRLARTLAALAAMATLSAMPIAAYGGTIFVTNSASGTIGEYTTSGATVNASLISTMAYTSGIAASGSDLFVENFTGTVSTICEYTTSGGTVKAPLIPGARQSHRHRGIRLRSVCRELGECVRHSRIYDVGWHGERLARHGFN